MSLYKIIKIVDTKLLNKEKGKKDEIWKIDKGYIDNNANI